MNVYHKPAIDSFVINMFFRPIVQKLENKVYIVYMDMQDKFGFNVEDVKDEIFDMSKPATPFAITLQDLLNCGQGDIIISMLIDAKAFYEYDQRESGQILETEDYEDF